MEQAEMLAGMIGGEIGKAIRDHSGEVTEIRLRANRVSRIRLISGVEIGICALEQSQFQKILLRLMENSLYARESELREGYFTAPGGCRVGVCGKWNRESGMVNSGSLCIRLAREVIGCAEPLIGYLQRQDCRGMLILSQPGMGKTTLLRDLARLASDSGMNVAIADERREISGCVEGIPRLDVGERTDVMDGCPKELSIPMLIRACAPDAVFADEIGGTGDAAAIIDAQRCGVKVVATAHAEKYADAAARYGIGELLRGGVFQYVVQLGESPGKIISIEKYDCGDA